MGQFFIFYLTPESEQKVHRKPKLM